MDRTTMLDNMRHLRNTRGVGLIAETLDAAIQEIEKYNGDGTPSPDTIAHRRVQSCYEAIDRMLVEKLGEHTETGAIVRENVRNAFQAHYSVSIVTGDRSE